MNIAKKDIKHIKHKYVLSINTILSLNTIIIGADLQTLFLDTFIMAISTS